jgi:hypothetical protein
MTAIITYALAFDKNIPITGEMATDGDILNLDASGILFTDDSSRIYKWLARTLIKTTPKKS